MSSVPVPSQSLKQEQEQEQPTKKPRIDIDKLLEGFEEPPEECPICLDEIPKEKLRRLGCSHKMCITCISNIINTQGLGKCPFCRVFIKPSEDIRKIKIYQLRALIKSCYHRSPNDKIEINQMLMRFKQLKIDGYDVKMSDVIKGLCEIVYHPILQQIIKDLKEVYDL